MTCIDKIKTEPKSTSHQYSNISILNQNQEKMLTFLLGTIIHWSEFHKPYLKRDALNGLYGGSYLGDGISETPFHCD